MIIGIRISTTPTTTTVIINKSNRHQSGSDNNSTHFSMRDQTLSDRSHRTALNRKSDGARVYVCRAVFLLRDI